jgi:uncharacterized membrane protein YfcA
VPLTLLAGAGHWLLGSIDWSLLLSLLVGSLPGIAIGSYLSSRAPDALLRNILAATLTLVGVKLVMACASGCGAAGLPPCQSAARAAKTI